MNARNLLSMYWFVFFAALGVFFPFFSLYLDENAGLSGTEVGLVMASVPLTGMLAQPLWGLAADRSGRRARLLAILTACSAFGYAALFWALDFRSLLVGTMALSIFATAVVPLCISVCFSLLSASGPHAFGHTRVWGTVGFLVAVVSFPALLDTLHARGWVGRSMSGATEPGLELMLPVTALLTLVAAGIAMLLPDRPVDQERTMRPGEWRVLLAHGPFLRFLLFIVGAYLFLQGPTSLFPLFVRSLGGDMDSVSHLWVLMVALEIPLVAYSGAGFARLGPRVLLAVGIGCGAVRWLVSGFAEDWRVIYAVQALHGITVGGLIIGAPYYVDAIVPSRLRSTAQGILSMAGVSLGGILSNLLTGALIEHYGARAPAILGGAGALLLTLLLPTMVARTASAVLPDTVLGEPLSADPLA
ncbi:MAG TPA: MFS transporter [Candidatus Binatia bacterium]|nr:MFS transporter [Candidatus Binatia bacterium]